MPDLLLELLSEEIPARMQAQAARDLERMARERLAAADLAFRVMRSFAGPRRLTLAVDGLPPAQADRSEERKGPRANAPEQAVAGFLRSTGLTRDQLTERDGVFYATLHRPGRPTPLILAEMVEQIIRAFPWPKSMRWGSGTLRWVRPLKRIACIFDGAMVPFEIELGGGAAIASSNLTEGHRFMGPDRGDDRAPFGVTGLEDYAGRLADRYVVLDPAERRARIAAGCRAVCEAKGLEWVQDEGLLDEVVGLAEWPVPILGDMDAGFLDLPAEVIRTSMRVHQRYFAVRDPKTGALAPHFVVTANIEPGDGGAVIAHGNARVLTARLADARFFWDEDRRPGNFDRWAEKLNGVTFHAKLGTMAERVERIAALAREIAPLVGADPDLAETAARLCKADLASGMVGEFPELQGVMGGYYVRALSTAPDMAGPFPLEGGRAGMGVEAPPSGGSPEAAPSADQPSDGAATTPSPSPSPLQGEGSLAALAPADLARIADAVRDHYKPLGPSDSVPVEPVTVAVALADKLDTLVGFFAIDERPTGSKDPYALRRAALGVMNLIRQSGDSFPLRYAMQLAVTAQIGKNKHRGHFVDMAAVQDAQSVPNPKFLWNNLPVKTWLNFDGLLEVGRVDPLSGNYIQWAQTGYPGLDEEDTTLESKQAAYAHETLCDRLKILDDQNIIWTFGDVILPDMHGIVPVISNSAISRSHADLLNRTPGVFSYLDDLLAFFADRLKVLLRDEGKRHDLVDAVFAPIDGQADDDLVRIVRRVEALSAFLATEDGASLLAGYRRAANILKAEAKKAPEEDHAHAWDPGLLEAPQERALSAALRTAKGQVEAALEAGDFAAAMQAFSRLRGPVDAFFDGVLVNAPDTAVRLNRLRLLGGVRETANRIADFSKVSG